MGNERFIFWSPQQHVDMHAGFMICIHFTLFAQRLPNDFLNNSFFQTPALRDAKLCCAALCAAVTWETAIFVRSKNGT